MKRAACRPCRLVGTALLSVLLGGAGGFGVLAYGGSPGLSMLATFLGAILPVMWLARQDRVR